MQVILGLFALIQAIGAIVGAGGAVVSELSYLKAMQHRRVEHAEKAHLATIARTLRWGMMLLLIGSTGLVFLDYIFAVPLQPALTSSYWVLMTLALVIIYSSWALSKRKSMFWLWSGIAFTAWWFIALLTLGKIPVQSYGASIALYVVATGIIAGVLAYARMLTAR